MRVDDPLDRNPFPGSDLLQYLAAWNPSRMVLGVAVTSVCNRQIRPKANEVPRKVDTLPTIYTLFECVRCVPELAPSAAIPAASGAAVLVQELLVSGHDARPRHPSSPSSCRFRTARLGLASSRPAAQTWPHLHAQHAARHQTSGLTSPEPSV